MMNYSIAYCLLNSIEHSKIYQKTPHMFMQIPEIILDDVPNNESDSFVNVELDGINILRDFGFEKDEARVYFELIRIGSAKASEVSNFSKIDRVRTYKILEKLKNLGFVISTLSSPIQFSAIDPENVLTNIILKQKQKIKKLEKNSFRFQKILSQIQIQEPQLESPKLTVISSRNNIYDQIIKLIEETKGELCFVAPTSDIIRMYYTSIPEAIKKASEQNLTIKLMADFELSTKLEYVKRLGITNFKIVSLPSAGRIICNNSQVLMSGNTLSTSNKNLDEESAMITNSSNIVKNMQSLCEFLWKTGKEVHVDGAPFSKKKQSDKQTILVVDDDPDAVNIFADCLEIKGISTVERCIDGTSALKMFKKIRPTVVFLDVMMPDFDGFYVMQQMRKIDSNTKIILVTGDMSPETSNKIKKFKPTDVIYKPYDIDQIVTYLKS